MEATKATEQRNHGIALLRVWLTFEVVVSHFGGGGCNAAEWPSNLPVPCFFVMAFYFSDKVTRHDAPLGKRLWRLFLPHLLWTVAYFLFFFPQTSHHGGNLVGLCSEGLLQLLTGHTLNISMWFQVVLIALTFLLWALRRTWAIVALAVVALALQYTGLNYELCSPLPFWASAPLGRVAECLPYAAVGCLMARFDVPRRLRGWFPLALLTLAALLVYTYAPRPAGFLYNGVGLLVAAPMLVLLFLRVPVPGGARPIVWSLSQVAMGIYAVHRLTYAVLFHVWNGPDSLLRTVVVWALSALMCWVLSLVPLRWVRAMVK